MVSKERDSVPEFRCWRTPHGVSMWHLFEDGSRSSLCGQQPDEFDILFEWCDDSPDICKRCDKLGGPSAVAAGSEGTAALTASPLRTMPAAPSSKESVS